MEENSSFFEYQTAVSAEKSVLFVLWNINDYPTIIVNNGSWKIRKERVNELEATALLWIS